MNSEYKSDLKYYLAANSIKSSHPLPIFYRALGLKQGYRLIGAIHSEYEAL